MTADLWAGLDLGTSGLKGVLVDAAGGVLARARADYPTDRPVPAAAEQDPAAWTAAAEAVVAALLRAVPAARWAGIGLSGMLPTLVTVDAGGGPIGPAVTWEDGRAEAEGEAFREEYGATELYRRTGQWVDGRYLLPMWRRIRATDPDRAARTRLLLGAKDFLLHRLTGAAVTDPSTAAGYGCYDLGTGGWQPDLGAAEAPGLPDVAPPGAGHPLTGPAAARLGLPEGLPVHVGAADSVLGALGLGAHRPGDVAYVAGTSTVVLGLAPRHPADPAPADPQHRFLVTPTATDGCWGVEMDLLATGAAIGWLTRLLGVADEATLLRMAAGADPVQAPVVLPYLGPGEQGALWDPDLLGSVVGLHLGHGPADLALGLLLGILVESRRCLLVLEEHGFGAGPVRVAGAAAADPWFARMLADASGRQVLTAAGDPGDHSAVGAAVVAAAAAGTVLPVGAAAVTTVEPDTSRSGWWEELAGRIDRGRSLVGHGLQR